MRILLADDDQDAREAVSRLLKRHGHEVTEARDGEGLLRAFAAAELPFQAVLTDCQMGFGPNGFSCAVRLRAKHKDLPIAIMSGDASVISLVGNITPTLNVAFLVKGLLTYDDFATALHLEERQT